MSDFTEEMIVLVKLFVQGVQFDFAELSFKTKLYMTAEHFTQLSFITIS